MSENKTQERKTSVAQRRLLLLPNKLVQEIPGVCETKKKLNAISWKLTHLISQFSDLET